MSDDFRYTLVMASLPWHGTLFGARRTPLSRLQLDRRLAHLTAPDAERLTRIETVIGWHRRRIDQSDPETLAEADRTVEALNDPVLASIVIERLSLRTLVAALRRRQRGDPAPDRRGRWGFGPWTAWIVRHWQEPDFGLGHLQPWVAEAAALLAEGDSLRLERLVLGQAWADLGRIGQDHGFDFPAVVVYVLRWHLIARWTAYQGESAAQRFDALTDAGLGSFGHLFSHHPGSSP